MHVSDEQFADDPSAGQILPALTEAVAIIERDSRASATLMGSRPAATQDGDDRHVALAARLGERIATRAAACDAEDRFPSESYDELRAAGYLALPVPTELGGLGATLRQLCYAQAELARHCGSTALAVAMHLHMAMASAWRWRRGDERERAVLDGVRDGLVLVTTIGTDGPFPSGLALRDGDGYRVTARKRFCSGAPAAGLLTTTAFSGEYEQGSVIEFRVPMSAPGVRVHETWQAHGMRATGSHDVELTDVWVAAQDVLARRQWGETAMTQRLTMLHMNPITSAVYHGIAAAARDVAVQHATMTARGPRYVCDGPEVRRQVGLMEYDLRTAWWSLVGALEQLGDDMEPDPAHVAVAALARRCAVTHAAEVVDLATDVVGGSSYMRGSPLERARRDVQAARFHAPTPEAALALAGKVAVGRACHKD